MKNSLLCLLLATLGSTALTQSSAPAALRAVQTYSGHKGPIENLAFSPDSTEVVVVAGQTAYVLNTKNYQLLRSFPMPIYTSKVSWLNREVLQVAGHSKVLQISAQDGHKIAGRQYGSAVSGDVVVRGELVAVDADQAIHLYDAATGLLARKIPYGSSYIDDFDLSLDGRRLKCV